MFVFLRANRKCANKDKFQVVVVHVDENRISLLHWRSLNYVAWPLALMELEPDQRAVFRSTDAPFVVVKVAQSVCGRVSDGLSDGIIEIGRCADGGDLSFMAEDGSHFVPDSLQVLCEDLLERRDTIGPKGVGAIVINGIPVFACNVEIELGASVWHRLQGELSV